MEPPRIVWLPRAGGPSSIDTDRGACVVRRDTGVVAPHGGDQGVSWTIPRVRARVYSESVMPDAALAERHAAFRALHGEGCFILPNPWDPGSARWLEHAGF